MQNVIASKPKIRTQIRPSFEDRRTNTFLVVFQYFLIGIRLNLIRSGRCTAIVRGHVSVSHALERDRSTLDKGESGSPPSARVPEHTGSDDGNGSRPPTSNPTEGVGRVQGEAGSGQVGRPRARRGPATLAERTHPAAGRKVGCEKERGESALRQQPNRQPEACGQGGEFLVLQDIFLYLGHTPTKRHNCKVRRSPSDVKAEAEGVLGARSLSGVVARDLSGLMDAEEAPHDPIAKCYRRSDG